MLVRFFNLNVAGAAGFEKAADHLTGEKEWRILLQCSGMEISTKQNGTWMTTNP